MVILESMACGTPVAAYHAPGPKDLIPGSGAGVTGDDLRANALACLELDREKTHQYAQKFSWAACAQDFLDNLSPLPPIERKRFWRRLRLPNRNRRSSPVPAKSKCCFIDQDNAYANEIAFCLLHEFCALHSC